jgi:hydrogenase maturation factor
MTDVRLLVGKLPANLLARVLGGAPDQPPEVLLGPALGEDGCALDVPSGVLVAATDPVTLTSREVGRFAVVVNANDVAVMGCAHAGSWRASSCHRASPVRMWRDCSP